MATYTIGNLDSGKVEQDLRNISPKFAVGSIEGVAVANALSKVARINRDGIDYANEHTDVLLSARNVLALCGVAGYVAY